MSGGDNRVFPPDDDRCFLERVVDEGVEGMTVDGRPVEPFPSWLARRRWRVLPAWLMASVASNRRDVLARHAQEQADYAAALERKAANARRDADATRLLIYAMQPGNAGPSSKSTSPLSAGRHSARAGLRGPGAAH